MKSLLLIIPLLFGACDDPGVTSNNAVVYDPAHIIMSDYDWVFADQFADLGMTLPYAHPERGYGVSMARGKESIFSGPNGTIRGEFDHGVKKVSVYVSGGPSGVAKYTLTAFGPEGNVLDRDVWTMAIYNSMYWLWFEVETEGPRAIRAWELTVETVQVSGTIQIQAYVSEIKFE